MGYFLKKCLVTVSILKPVSFQTSSVLQRMLTGLLCMYLHDTPLDPIVDR